MCSQAYSSAHTATHLLFKPFSEGKPIRSKLAYKDRRAKMSIKVQYKINGDHLRAGTQAELL